MAIIDQAKNHFKGRGRQMIEVPEWENGSGPVELYYQPITMQEQAKVYQAIERHGPAGIAKALIIKCESADGEKVFKPEDFFALIKAADPNVVSRIANAILDVPDVGDMEKNLKAIRP